VESKPKVDSAAAVPRRELGGLALQDLDCLVADPVLDFGVAFDGEGSGGFAQYSRTCTKSQITATVTQRQAASAVIASIWGVRRRQDDPSAVVVPRGATPGLVERCADDDGNVVGDRGCQPFPSL